MRITRIILRCFKRLYKANQAIYVEYDARVFSMTTMQCPRSRMTKRMPNESAQNKAELAYTTSPFYFVSRLLFRHDALSLHDWTRSN
jgi:hypothetical protein